MAKRLTPKDHAELFHEDAARIIQALADCWDDPEDAQPIDPFDRIMDNDATIRDWVMVAALNLRFSQPI